MALLIKNGTIVTMNQQREIITGDLLIEGDRIVNMGRIEARSGDEVLDARGDLVIPGLVQAHVHLCQTLFRGMADDLELLDWLKKRIWPLESSHDAESLYYSALLGCAELLRGGTTSIIDMGTVQHTDSIFEAVKLAGIRYLGGKCMMDFGAGVPAPLLETTDRSLQESLDLHQRWNGKENGRIAYTFCPRFAVSCTEDLLKQVARISLQEGIPVHTHASENRSEVALVLRERGMRNVLYLESLGLCNPGLILAHCIHIDDAEKQALIETRTNIVHCPGANLKLASGFAPIPELLEQGACLSLGSDGPPCNNNLNMFNEMRLAALIHKPSNGPSSMKAEEVFELATLGGARAMGLEKEIGSLEVGKKADLAIVSLNNWHTWPIGAASVYAQLVYQAQASDVRATVVDGRLLMQDGHLPGMDEEEVKQKSRVASQRISARAGV